MNGVDGSRQPVSCTVKPPVYLQIGESKAEPVQSGVCVVDVPLPFGKPVSVEEITFKNYYTAYVTVRLLRRASGQDGPTKWVTALRDLPLMDNPHTERGSQDYFSVHRKQVGQINGSANQKLLAQSRSEKDRFPPSQSRSTRILWIFFWADRSEEDPGEQTDNPSSVNVNPHKPDSMFRLLWTDSANTPRVQTSLPPTSTSQLWIPELKP
ncbi:hypothetical protein CCH79_00020861 [Gambusia affinis]|uniref:Uncharacterized protein n=1 Tax=Gambusia affinis TaxID=33528 RepID=A0A315W4F3_GAMAF|nr:hypothetical protein CCH79_00020861 [Gambusia affinis]